MKLNYRRINDFDAPPLIILHGLYGASDNWFTLSKEWAEYYDVISVDLRNHGQSPHSPNHNYEVLSRDVVELMDDLGLKKAVVLGHSMGGKVAMKLAMDFPERLNALIVVDIAPKDYLAGKDANIAKHRNIIRAMLKLDLSQIKKREDVDVILKPSIPEFSTRQFIMKNLKRTKSGGFKWKLNINALALNVDNITGGFPETSLHVEVKGFPVLFIKAEESDYIREEDLPTIKRLFPASELERIAHAGHWIHAEQSDALSAAVLDFLDDLY